MESHPSVRSSRALPPKTNNVPRSPRTQVKAQLEEEAAAPKQRESQKPNGSYPQSTWKAERGGGQGEARGARTICSRISRSGGLLKSAGPCIWMNCENILLSERNQTQQATYCVIPLVRKIKKRQTHRKH